MSANNLSLTISALAFIVNGATFGVAAQREEGRARVILRGIMVFCAVMIVVCGVLLLLPEG
jgi:threonine/homoserine/homoserine lactone efflux protein